MAPVIIDGRVKVGWCSAIANINAPTVAELNAGTALEQLITPDGLNIKKPTSKVAVSSLASKNNTYRAGRIDPDIMVKFHHDGSSDTAWNLLPYRTNGFLVVRRGVDATNAWASLDKVEVYPVEAGETDDVDPAENTVWDFELPLFVTSDPAYRAVVA